MSAQPLSRIHRDHVEVSLDDGQSAVLRPLRPQEEEPLLRVFDGMSELSRARRYLTGMPYLPPGVLQRLADVGHREHVAWLATIDGEPVGVARYAAYDHRKVDVALEVVDRWHGRGLGGVLLDTVATVARANGFTAVAATVHPGNHASVRLMRRIGLTLHVVDGVLEGEGPLRLPDPPRVDRYAVLEVADGYVGAAGLIRACAGGDDFDTMSLGGPMLVRVLGEVSLVSSTGTAVALPGSRQPALLAALVARAGHVVSADRLVDLLWDDPPENPAAALHSVVFKLRASLARLGGRELLLTREHGYLLDVQPGEVDAEIFEALVERARDEPSAEAAQTLGQALRLWKGRPYADFGDSEVAGAEVLRLEELQRVAVERYGVSLLDSGRADDAIAVMQPFVAEHGLREQARIVLMRALHAAGRAAEALDQYQDYRRELADELGLEPSAALVATQLAVLRGPPATTNTPLIRSQDHSLAGMQVRYLRTATGNTVAHATVGSGPKIVVILGWISSLHVIASGRDPRSSLLDRLTGDLALTVYDRAGTGLSPGPVEDYGMAAAVAELADVVRAVGPPVSLLAMSAAGPIALTLAHQHPDWVDSLALFGTFASASRTFPDEPLRQQVVDIARSHWGVGSKILADFYRPGLSDEAAWHLAKVFRDSASPEVAATYLEHIYEQEVSALLPSVETPALVLHYRGDRLIQFSGGQELAAGLPHATLLALDGRVHLPDAADLDVIEAAIVEHVRRHASGSATSRTGTSPE